MSEDQRLVGPPLADFVDGPVGLGERLEVDPSTGAATLTVPLPLLTDRTGAAPPLTLMHAGGGNSSVGLGWSLTVPSVQRIGDRGLPRYDESDRYVVAGVGEVSPALEDDGGGGWRPSRRGVDEFEVRRHTPVVGHPTHVVEQWIHRPNGTSSWRVEGADGSVAVYGESAAARTADPADPTRIATWHLERSWDLAGNAFAYEYKPEDFAGVSREDPAEAARIRRGIPAGTYLKRVHYANRTPFDPGDPNADVGFRLEVVLDYGEHDTADPVTAGDETAPWALRPDPFSRYQGFEARTYRRCRRVLLFSRYPVLAPEARLTDVVALTYDDVDQNRAASRLRSIERIGHRAELGGWWQATAPLTFSYAQAGPESVSRALETDDGRPLATADVAQWTDVFGEGIHHLLYRRSGAWAFRPNRGGGRVGAEVLLDELPSAAMAGVGALGDVETNGSRDLVVATPETAGFHALDAHTRSWAPLHAFDQVARLGGVGAAALDCTGDGSADALVGSLDDVVWFESAGAAGDRSPQRVAGSDDGPPQLQAEPGRGIFLLDMNGDGLADVVRVRNGDVTYWPSLGHGRFAPAVTMAHSPRFDHDDRFDPLRLRFADLDGSGTPDVLYLGGQVTLWCNLAGNGFASGEVLEGLPTAHAATTAEIVDLEADGTRCLVWTSTLPGDAGAPVRYLQLTPGGPPGRLTGYTNGRGSEVRLTHGSSARMYLDALEQGRPWPLPIGAHPDVVTRLERIDHVTGSVTHESFTYHDAVTDPEDGGLATFGFVERQDTESPAHHPELAQDEHVDAVVVRTWFHPGERADDPQLALRWGARAFAADPAARPLVASAVDVDAFPDADRGDGRPTRRAALRALAGRPVRQEVFAAADLTSPYQVSQSRFVARPQQPASDRGAGRRGATAVEPAETLIHVYDAATEDPRIEHTVHLDIDRYGRDERLVTIAYGRRPDRAVHPDQRVTHVTVEESEVADLVGAASTAPGARATRSLGLLLERRRYEVVGVALDADHLVTPTSLRPQLDTAIAAAHPYDADLSDTVGPAARLTEWERHRYVDGVGAETGDPGTIDLPARLARTRIAAFPERLAAAQLPGEIDAAELRRIGYEQADGYWWRRGPRREYRPAAGFHLLRRSTDVFGGAEQLEFDDELRTLAAVVDELGLRTTYEVDYVTLEPTRRTDENDVIAEVRFDPLRRVRCRSVRGRTRRQAGDVAVAGDEPLLGHVPQPDVALADVLADPGAFVQGAAAAAHYDDRAWHDHVSVGGDPSAAPPPTVAVLTRTRHHRVDSSAPIEAIVSHYDAAGNACQRKRRVAAGSAFVAAPGGVAEQDVPDRWLCTGRAVHNNKGLAMRSFASLHTDNPGYEPEALFASVGVATRLSYDPMGRLVRTETPAGFHSAAERGAWAIRTFDENDTVERSHALTVRVPAGEITDPATLGGIEAARAHADTPTVAHLDAKGRPFLLWAHTADAPEPLQTHHRYTASGHTERLVDPRQFAANAARPADQQVGSAVFVRDMQGVPLVEQTADAGRVRLLVDVLNRPVHRWDARGVHLFEVRDGGGRLVEVRATGPGGGAPVTVERYRYGDGSAGAADRNQRGRLVAVDDQAGRRTIARYDHEGRALETTRTFAEEYRDRLDWSAAPVLENETFLSRSTYDALGRVERHERPDGSMQLTSYVLGGTAARVRVRTPDGAVDEQFLTDVTHDARGHRTGEGHGNGMATALVFDEETSQLRRQTTTAPAGTLAEVAYGYDPVGNLTLRDDKTRTHLITNVPAVPADQQPERFTYDAMYRLVEATGWTHEALQAGDSAGSASGTVQGARHLSLNDGQLLRRYRRRYRWDAAGNLEELRHLSAAGNFTRAMWIDDRSNRSVPRLRPDGTVRPDPASAFDASGNLTVLDRLRRLRWDHHGRLVAAVVIERPSPGFDDAQYTVHGADGTRVRKVDERLDHDQRLVGDTRYFAGCSLTRRRRGTTLEFERWTTHADLGPRRLGVVHRWTRDTRQLEVDVSGTTAVRYTVTIEGGHSHLVVDETAAVVSFETYTPFGETAFVAGDRVRDLLPRRERFAGRERDDVTGFVTFPFRSYAPWMCRWVSPDPLGIADGPNLYGYVHGNPTTHRDGLGFETDEERRREEWRKLLGSAVSFESLPEHIQERARSGWLTASEQGSAVYVYDPRHGLERFTDPEQVNRDIAADRAVAIRTIAPERAQFERTMDELREAMRALDDLTAPSSPLSLDPKDAAGPRPVGDRPGGTGDPAGTSPPSSTGDPASNDPNAPTVPGVSVSAAGKAAQNLPDETPSIRPQPADRVPNELPEDARRWGDGEAARRDLLDRPEFRDGRVPADFGREVPEGVRPGQLDPHGPAAGEFGHVAQHGDHHSAQRPARKADYLDQDDVRSRRLTEREHGAARGQLEELSHVRDGDPQYRQSHYDNDVTVWTERDTALNKTHANRGGPGADNPTTARMRQHRQAGGAHDFAETFENARSNYHRAITDTGSAVPTRSADIGIFHQMSNASGMNTTAETAARLPEGAADDIDRALARMGESDAYRWAGADAPRVPDVSVPSGGSRTVGALKSGGRVALQALGPLGTGLSVYAFASARTTEDRILAGADLGADLIGYAGPVGAVFSISYGVTRAVDEGIGWASKEYLGRDLSPSSVTADGMVAVDQALTSLWADPSKPAYTQTIGWKLAGFFDSL
jgi:RHS repeat-associated protein